jgi:hypothetical protein
MGVKLVCHTKGGAQTVFENRVLRRIFVPERRKWQETGIDCIMRNFITCTIHQILFG